VRAAIDTHTPIIYQDWTLDGGGDASVRVPADHNALVYVFQGAALVGDDGKEVKEGQMAVLADGDALRLRAAEGGRARLLLLAGVPHREPVVAHGPFVMTTEREIIEAMRDYQTGKMGEITRTARQG
jgi:redox-sensitive bicupin YhaK (pirin superfamily)